MSESVLCMLTDCVCVIDDELCMCLSGMYVIIVLLAIAVVVIVCVPYNK